jgi:hypothetical protein
MLCGGGAQVGTRKNPPGGGGGIIASRTGWLWRAATEPEPALLNFSNRMTINIIIIIIIISVGAALIFL